MKLQPEIEWVSENSFSVTVNGYEIIRVDDIEEGVATVIVWESFKPLAEQAWTGTIQVTA